MLKRILSPLVYRTYSCSQQLQIIKPLFIKYKPQPMLLNPLPNYQHFSTQIESVNRYENDEYNATSDPDADIKPAFKKSKEEIKDASREIAELDETNQRMLKIIKMEVDLLETAGNRVPDNINDAMWLDLLKTCKTRRSRMQRLRYWFKCEKSYASQQKKKYERRQIHEEKQMVKKKLIEEGILPQYKNTYLLRVPNQKMNQHYSNNLCYAMVNGPHLVLDMGFEEHMTNKEMKDLISQLHQIHGANKLSLEPFHIHLVNVAIGGKVDKHLDYHLPEFKGHVPISVTDKSYLDLYPKEKLVYLSPNSRNVLSSLDPDDVYIVGGIVDLANEQPLTLAKSKRENIRTAKLPLDNYMRWVQGSKSLPLNQICRILLTFKETEDWRKAFKHVPSRKAILC